MSVIINQANSQVEMRLFPLNDFTTLEYDDRVRLTFTASNPALFPGLEAAGEFIRNIAIINIIDDDSKCFSYTVCAFKYSHLPSAGDKL